MPIYEYLCENGHSFEVMQRMTDDSLSSCTQCGAEVRRVLFAPAVHYKGSGFYSTDYGKKKSSGEGSSSGSESSGEGGSSNGSSGSDSSGSESSGEKKSSASKETSSASSGSDSSSSSSSSD